MYRFVETAVDRSSSVVEIGFFVQGLGRRSFLIFLVGSGLMIEGADVEVDVLES